MTEIALIHTHNDAAVLIRQASWRGKTLLREEPRADRMLKNTAEATDDLESKDREITLTWLRLGQMS